MCTIKFITATLRTLCGLTAEHVPFSLVAPCIALAGTFLSQVDSLSVTPAFLGYISMTAFVVLQMCLKLCSMSPQQPISNTEKMNEQLIIAIFPLLEKTFP